MTHFNIFTRRIAGLARSGPFVNVRWVAWVPGLGFSVEGDTQAAAVGELVILLHQNPDLVGEPLAGDDLAELLADESAELVEAEGGAA